MKVEADPSPGSPLIPEILYSFFQMEFACVTAGLIMGGLAERGRVFPAMIFIFFWVTLVYCPLACWAWSTHGWAFKWGVLDFAGGYKIISVGISSIYFFYHKVAAPLKLEAVSVAWLIPGLSVGGTKKSCLTSALIMLRWLAWEVS